jgi:hypothetical protein
MDARQFDGLAKALRSGADRRRVLGVFAGGLVATLRGPRATEADHKPPHCGKEGQPVKTKTKKGCCDGLLACEILDCSGDICVPTPQSPVCVDVQSDPFHCGNCEQSCDDECCHGECCFSTSGQGQVCLPEGCGCEDPRLIPCGVNCVDLATDPANCGACGASCCGTTCTGQEACASGHCV